MPGGRVPTEADQLAEGTLFIAQYHDHRLVTWSACCDIVMDARMYSIEFISHNIKTKKLYIDMILVIGCFAIDFHNIIIFSSGLIAVSNRILLNIYVIHLCNLVFWSLIHFFLF